MTGLRLVERDASWLRPFSPLRPPHPEEVLERVSAEMLHAGTPLDRAEWVFARWKRGHSLTTAHRLVFSDGDEAILTWKAFEDGKADALAERSPWFESMPASGPWQRRRWVEPALGIELWVAPFDRELIGLEPTLDARWVARALEETGAVPERSVRRRRLEQQLLRYKPQRRAVFRGRAQLRPDGSCEYGLRVLTPDAAGRTIRARRIFDTLTAGKFSPRLLHGDEPRGVLIEEWRAGQSREREDFSDPEGIGELLGRWHTIPIDDPVPSTVPRSITGARALLEAVLGHAPPLPANPPRGTRVSWIHGDLHPDQVLETESGLALLDLDELGVGEAAGDLSSWLADAACALSESEYREHRDALLRSYRRHRLVEDAAVDQFMVCELVRRAAGCLRRLERDAPARAAQILELIDTRVLGGAAR